MLAQLRPLRMLAWWLSGTLHSYIILHLFFQTFLTDNFQKISPNWGHKCWKMRNEQKVGYVLIDFPLLAYCVALVASTRFKEDLFLLLYFSFRLLWRDNFHRISSNWGHNYWIIRNEQKVGYVLINVHLLAYCVAFLAWNKFKEFHVFFFTFALGLSWEMIFIKLVPIEHISVEK